LYFYGHAAPIHGLEMEAAMDRIEPNGVIGRPTPRIDGAAKVTGRALYGADNGPKETLHAALRTSDIARGRIVSIDRSRALAIPGVHLILTYENARVKPGKHLMQGGYMPSGFAPLGSNEVHFSGQAVAIAFADTFEQAEQAAQALDIRYVAEPPTASIDDPGMDEWPNPKAQRKTELKAGDFDAGYAAAAVKIEAVYETAAQHHNPMELFQTTCAWQDGKLTVWESTQSPRGLQYGLAEQLSVAPEAICVRSPFVGGAFGSRGQPPHYTALIAYGSKLLDRPVKLVVSRRQGFTQRTFRAETRHRVRLAAAKDGRLQALSHESWELTSRDDMYLVAGSANTARLYACPNIVTKVHNVRADRQTPGFMRAPPEFPYMYALESAMDELSYALGVDPIALRRINDTRTDPIETLPFSSRHLMECYDLAAQTFDWSRRDPRPKAMRDGDWLVGYGCATAYYPANIGAAQARVTLFPDNRAKVEIGTQDIGNGAYTIMAQTVADRLGVPVQNVEVVIGDSVLPPAPITAGSNSAASTCNAVAHACDQLKAGLKGPVTTPVSVTADTIPEGLQPDALASVAKGKPGMIGGIAKQNLRFAFGAHLVEVRVHAATGEIRAHRAVGAFAAGRIVNPVTARSQLMGGQIWGIEAALMEGTDIDRGRARYMNADLAEYHVAVNADIGEVVTLLVPETDTAINPLGIKGVGELGNTGMNAAVANAVFHATGVRVRKIPIRLDDVMKGLPAVEQA
jgi:xanthine dehydrogenase YagR molybdenum-binding subunit